MVNDMETDTGKGSILSPPLKKSFLESASKKTYQRDWQDKDGALVVWEIEDVSRPRVPPIYASYVRKTQDRHLGPPR
jgi:hypothetical protein